MKNLFFAKNKTRRNPSFFVISIVEKYAVYRFAKNAQTHTHRAIPQIKTLAKKPRFFCKCFGAKTKIKKRRKSAKNFFHFCENKTCKKTLVFCKINLRNNKKSRIF